MDNLTRDLRYAFRMLRTSPGFTCLAVAALALGIGANTTLFSVVSGVLFHTLPYDRADEVVMLWDDSSPRGGTNRVPVTPANFLDWRERNSAFTELAAVRNESLRLTSLDQPLVPLMHKVTPNYFRLLGVESHLGRTFVPEDGQPGKDRVVIISYGLWQRVLGGDPSIIDTTLALDDEPYTIIGVMPADFFSVHIFNVQPDLWTPLVLAGSENERSERRLSVYARLRDDTGLQQARAAMHTVAERLAVDFPETNSGWDIRVVPILEESVGRVRTALLVLLGAVGFVLLIACANVANMTLARAAERAREMALRTALGASGWLLSRQLIVESVVLAGLGGAVGLLLAAFGLKPLLTLIPPGANVPFLEHVAIDWSVLLATLGITLVTGVVFGLVPARQARRRDLHDPLKEGGRSRSPETRRFGSFLVVAEVTFALVLMAGAGLMIQSFRNLKGLTPGFNVRQTLTVRNALRGDGLSQAHQRVQYFEELNRRLSALPGVESASAVSFAPPIPPFRAMTFRIPGEPVEPGLEPTGTGLSVMPGYFQTLQIPLLGGRLLGDEDRADAFPVVVINEALARRHFAGRDPVGESLIIASSAQSEMSAIQTARRIVGVVGNVRRAGSSPEPTPLIYVPYPQAPVSVMSLVLRARDDPDDLLRAAEQTVWSMGGDINVYGAETLLARTANFEWATDVSTLLLGLFATLALVLGAAGIYAVISYGVAKQTKEIGLRMALGANRLSVLSMVLGSSMKLTAIGVVTGLGASLLVSRWMGSLLYGVRANDVKTYAAAALVLLGVAAAAALWPAYRATRIDPIAALRQS